MNSRKRYRVKKRISFIILALCILTGCGATENKSALNSVSQLNDSSYTVGVGIGAASELAVKETLPDAKIVYIDVPDAYKAVSQESGFSMKQSVRKSRLLLVSHR
ncbi:MAG: hypothetical protein K6G30_09300 [Acetatifactor sp.]|nr:hypothetical protein [Acetatifactor sp.]